MPDGKPVRDKDYNHGGVGHEFPHEHEKDNYDTMGYLLGLK